MGTPIKITATLASPVCGEVPHLDALLECLIARKAESIERDSCNGRHGGFVAWRDRVDPTAQRHDGVDHLLCRRVNEPPPVGMLPIPIERGHVDGWPVAHCSSPIYVVQHDGVEHLQKRIDSNEIGDLLGGRRMSIHHGTGSTKAYFKPLRVRVLDRVVWFAVGYGFSKGKGQRRRGAVSEMRRWLQKIDSIGANRQAGYGRVARWAVEDVENDWSWYADHCGQRVLMRPLPRPVEPDVVGWSPGYASVCPPYWHPQRHIEAAIPC